MLGYPKLTRSKRTVVGCLLVYSVSGIGRIIKLVETVPTANSTMFSRGILYKCQDLQSPQKNIWRENIICCSFFFNQGIESGGGRRAATLLATGSDLVALAAIWLVQHQRQCEESEQKSNNFNTGTFAGARCECPCAFVFLRQRKRRLPKVAPSVLMLCAPVFIFTSGSSAL